MKRRMIAFILSVLLVTYFYHPVEIYAQDAHNNDTGMYPVVTMQ